MSKEYCCATDRVVLSARSRFFGVARATIEAQGEREVWQSQRISRITVEYQDSLFRRKSVEIPRAALDYAGPVYVNRWEFRDEESVRSGFKGLYLVVFAPHEMSKDVWRDKELHFIIEDGVFQRLAINVPITENSWQGDGWELK